MRFLALLRGGATPKFAARVFLDDLFKRSEEQKDLCWFICAEFITDCLLAINIKATITAEDAENNFKDFKWPVEALRIYVFMYNKVTFAQFESFLYQIGTLTKTAQEEWIKNNSDKVTENYMEEFLTPLETFMQLIAVWVAAYKQLINSENLDFLPKYFEEPIARINFQLLRGVRYLRLFYHRDMPLLDNICDTLLRTAHLGILFPGSHSEVLNGLLDMFKEDFHIFYRFSPSSVDFFYKTLTSKCPKKSYQLVYKSLMELLQSYGLNFADLNVENANTEAHQRSIAITNFMIETRMLNIYYHHLVKDNKAVYLMVIDLLLILQSKLASIDCFTDVFMEAILFFALSSDKNLGNHAAELYITMIQRRTNAETTLKHIIGYYFAKMNTNELLPLYVQRLCKYFQPMWNINYYTAALIQRNIDAKPARIMTAHFVVAIFRYLLKRFGLRESIVQQFLSKLFDIIKKQKCQFTQATLLDVFSAVQGVIAQDDETVMEQLFLSFEEHAQLQFDNLKNVQYPLLKKWFLLWEFFSSKRGDLQKIHESVTALIAKYTAFMENTQRFFENLNVNAVRKYRCILHRLCLVTQSNYLVLENQNAILIDIQNGLIRTEAHGYGIFYDYASKTKTLIDVYALEIYTTSFLKIFELTNSSSDRTENSWIDTKVQELDTHLRSWIENPDFLLNHPIIRIKTLIICFFEIHLVFGSDPNYKILDLHLKTYEILIRFLSEVIFKKKPSQHSTDSDEEMLMHPQNTLACKRLMIKRFENFHKCSGVNIDSNSVWHFCFYFALPEADQFKIEMENFMRTLAKYCFSIFHRIVPIIIFNLYSKHRDLSFQTILNAIKAHKSFLDSLEMDDRAILNVSIVINVIERVENSCIRNTVGRQPDRLAPLKHLKKFLENVDLRNSGENLITQIVDKAKNLRQNLLNSAELRTLNEFLDAFHVETNT